MLKAVRRGASVLAVRPATRQLLLTPLLQPNDGFRCPVCGFAFVPADASGAADSGDWSWSPIRPGSPRSRGLGR
jgi:hypothetical protein